jgi:hypothetical protein
MRGVLVKAVLGGLAASLIGLSAAMAVPVPGTGPGSGATLAMPAYPGKPPKIADVPFSPYPMTYSDQAAQALGIHNGRMDLFSTHPRAGLMPVVSGGVGAGGAMLKLQWHPGE